MTTYLIMQTALVLICVGFGASVAVVVLSPTMRAKDREIRRLTQHKRDLLRWVRAGVRLGLEVNPWVENEIAKFEGKRD